MAVSLTPGAYLSFERLCLDAANSTAKYAPFPRLSGQRESIRVWKKSLLDQKCIKEIKVGGQTYYSPLIKIDDIKKPDKKSPGRPLMALQKSKKEQNAQGTLPLKDGSTTVTACLTPGAYESFHALYRNAVDSPEKHTTFPRLTNNRDSIVRWRKELLEKKCIEEVETGARDKRFFRPIIAPSQTKMSKDNRGARRNEIAPAVRVMDAPQVQHEHPISRGRHLPTAHELIDFVNAVQREIHVRKADRMERIEKELHQVKQLLLKPEDVDHEMLYGRELMKLLEERKNLNHEAVIDAVKYVEAREEFSSHQWAGNIVSVRPEDYGLS